MLSRQFSNFLKKRSIASTTFSKGSNSEKAFMKKLASLSSDKTSSTEDFSSNNSSESFDNDISMDTSFLYSNELNSHLLKRNSSSKKYDISLLSSSSNVKTFSELEKELSTFILDSNSISLFKDGFDVAFETMSNIKASSSAAASPTLYGLFALMSRHLMSFREMRSIFANAPEPEDSGSVFKMMQTLKTWMVEGGQSEENNLIFPMFVYESLCCWSGKANPSVLLLDVARHLEGLGITPSQIFYNRLLLQLGRNGGINATNATFLYETLKKNSMVDLDTRIIRMCNLKNLILNSSSSLDFDLKEIESLYQELLKDNEGEMTSGQRRVFFLSYLSSILRGRVNSLPPISNEIISLIKDILQRHKDRSLLPTSQLSSLIVGYFYYSKVALPGFNVSGDTSKPATSDSGDAMLSLEVEKIINELQLVSENSMNPFWNGVLAKFYSLQGDSKKVLEILERGIGFTGGAGGVFLQELITIIASTVIPYNIKNLISNYVKNHCLGSPFGTSTTNDGNGIIRGLFKPRIPYKEGGLNASILSSLSSNSMIRMIIPIIELMEIKGIEIPLNSYTSIINLLNYYKVDKKIIKSVFTFLTENHKQKPNANLYNAYLNALLKEDPGSDVNPLSSLSPSIYDDEISKIVELMENDRLSMRSFLKAKLNERSKIIF